MYIVSYVDKDLLKIREPYRNMGSAIKRLHYLYDNGHYEATLGIDNLDYSVNLLTEEGYENRRSDAQGVNLLVDKFLTDEKIKEIRIKKS